MGCTSSHRRTPSNPHAEAARLFRLYGITVSASVLLPIRSSQRRQNNVTDLTVTFETPDLAEYELSVRLHEPVVLWKVRLHELCPRSIAPPAAASLERAGTELQEQLSGEQCGVQPGDRLRIKFQRPIAVQLQRGGPNYYNRDCMCVFDRED